MIAHRTWSKILCRIRDCLPVTFACFLPTEGACDLSNEEISVDLVAPAFLQRHRSASQSLIHAPSDVNRWVVDYATLMVAEYIKRALLRYELDLDIPQRVQIKESSSNDNNKVQVGANNCVIGQQDKIINTSNTANTEERSSYFESGKNIEDIVSANDNGKNYLAAYQIVSDWFVLALEESGFAVLNKQRNSA